MSEIRYQVALHMPERDSAGTETVKTTAVEVPAEMTVGELVERLLHRTNTTRVREDGREADPWNPKETDRETTTVHPLAARWLTVRASVSVDAAAAGILWG